LFFGYSALDPRSHIFGFPEISRACETKTLDQARLENGSGPLKWTFCLGSSSGEVVSSDRRQLLSKQKASDDLLLEEKAALLPPLAVIARDMALPLTAAFLLRVACLPPAARNALFCYQIVGCWSSRRTELYLPAGIALYKVLPRTARLFASTVPLSAFGIK
jgi:hypothetical protein